MKYRPSKSAQARPGWDSATSIALEWLVRLQDTDCDPEEPYPDIHERQRIFLEWLKQSPEHVRAFMEAIELEQRVSQPDPQRLIKAQELLKVSGANVVSLLRTAPVAAGALQPLQKRRRLHVPVAIAAAAVAVLLFVLFNSTSPRVYTTGIGEQQTRKLQDGSVVALNTDTRIEIDFTDRRRDVRLIHGEALFIVEHDAHRPFTVDAGGTQVRAIGTQFDVHRRSHSTMIAVVEGAVQVSTVPAANKHQTRMKAALPEPVSAEAKVAQPAPTTLRLVAGEKAQVTNGAITTATSHDDVLSWRQRRLVFRDTPLAEVAAEFNRYNRAQIQVRDSAAGNMQITGTFDADRPQALALFAQKHESLLTETEGQNWVIRSQW